MKTKNMILALALVSATTFVACKKDKDEPKLTPTEQKLIKTWTLEALTTPRKTNPEVDSSLVTDCMEDVSLQFVAGRTFEFKNSNQGCEGTVLPFQKGKWSLSADGKTLILKGAKESKWTVKTLDETTLKATFRDSVSVDHNYLKTVTFKK